MSAGRWAFMLYALALQGCAPSLPGPATGVAVVNRGPAPVLELSTTNGLPSEVNRLSLDGGCHVRVDLASVGRGVDDALVSAAREQLRFAAGVSQVFQQRWGRKGEASLCAEVPSPGDRQRINDTTEQRLGALVASVAGYATVTKLMIPLDPSDDSTYFRNP